jgi:fructose-specific phosphotransferase system IIC component
MTRDIFTYYTAWGEKRLTGFGAISCILSVLIGLAVAAVFFGSSFIGGLIIGFAIGAVVIHLSNEREAVNRALRERSFE